MRHALRLHKVTDVARHPCQTLLGSHQSRKSVGGSQRWGIIRNSIGLCTPFGGNTMSENARRFVSTAAQWAELESWVSPSRRPTMALGAGSGYLSRLGAMLLEQNEPRAMTPLLHHRMRHILGLANGRPRNTLPSPLHHLREPTA
jgi:hypothetical protein